MRRRIPAATGSAVFVLLAVAAVRSGGREPRLPLSDQLMERGLAEEQSDPAQAERDLLEAARLDHQYLPAWTLTNFYFRRGSSEFWPWARKAARLSYDGFRPLLELANAGEPDPLAVIERLGGAEKLTLDELDVLISEGRLDAAQTVARSWLDPGLPDHAKRLADLSRRIEEKGSQAAHKP